MSFRSLKALFDHEARHHPDLMEPWIIRLSDLPTEEEQTEVMRRALMVTVKDRYPTPEGRAA